MVGVLSRSLTQWYFAEAVTAIEEALSAANHRVMLYNIGNPASRRTFFEQALLRGEVDALVVVSFSFDEHERQVLENAGVPIVVLGGFVPGRRCVGIDEVAAARMAVRHLIGLGHREIGMLSFDPKDQVSLESTHARQHGFELALAEAELSVVPEWIVVAEGSRMAGGVRVAERLLTQPRLPTALFAMSDELAIGALGALRRAGLSLPGHMSLVALDDHEMAPFVDLTTIHQPVREQAMEAVRLLLEGQTDSATKTELPVRLVVRGTTGPRQ
ncbi:MAG: substrate-binding domain-containing protein [Microlunatus sp.]